MRSNFFVKKLLQVKNKYLPLQGERGFNLERT
jgi:hypothetical protein